MLEPGNDVAEVSPQQWASILAKPSSKSTGSH